MLVGWSYGAFLALHWAARNPHRVAGVVAVDGGIPYGLSGEAGRERIRALFRRMRWLLPLVRPLSLAARMSAEQHADINIELNELAANLMPVLEQVTCPVRYVLVSGGNIGSNRAEMEAVRKALDPLLARKPNFTVSAKVASDHGNILRRDFRAVAHAARETAACVASGAPAAR